MKHAQGSLLCQIQGNLYQHPAMPLFQLLQVQKQHILHILHQVPVPCSSLHEKEPPEPSELNIM